MQNLCLCQFTSGTAEQCRVRNGLFNQRRCGSVGNGVEERRARRPTAEHALPRKGGAAGPSWRGPPGPHVSIQRPMGPVFLGQSKIPSQLHTVVSSQQIILKNETNYSTVPNHITVTSHSKKKRYIVQKYSYNRITKKLVLKTYSL